MSTFPDYYSLLNVSHNASIDEIRTAYKKESLKCASPIFLYSCLAFISPQSQDSPR